MKLYTGRRVNGSAVVRVIENGEARALPVRLDLFNHSPDGFEWGYGKWKVIANLPQESEWQLTEEQVTEHAAELASAQPFGSMWVVLAAVILLASTVATSAKVPCQTAQGQGGNWWAWRLIDGKKCWYQGKPGMDKTALYWPARVAAVAPVPPEEELRPQPGPQIEPAPYYVPPEPPPMPTPLPLPKRRVVDAAEEMAAAPEIPARGDAGTSAERSRDSEMQPRAAGRSIPSAGPSGRQIAIMALLTLTGLCLCTLAMLMRFDPHARWR